MFETLIEDYLNWYYLIIALSLIIGIVAGYNTKSGIPIIWTVLLSLILHFGNVYLEPMLLGLQYINYSLLGVMLPIISVCWIIILLITHYNLLKYGKVWGSKNKSPNEKPNNAILSIMVLLLLIMPIVSMIAVEDNQKENILSLGKYNYNMIDLKPTTYNLTEMENHFDIVLSEVIYSNNPTIFNFDWLGLANIRVLATDNLTYIGNNTYSVDTSGLTQPYIFIPINITTHNLSKYDMFLIESDEIAYIQWFTDDNDDANYVEIPYEVSIDKYLSIITITDKVNLLNSDDRNILLAYYSGYSDDMTFKVSYGINDDNATVFISDMTYYYIISTATIILSALTIIFATEKVDVIINKMKKV